MRTAVRRVAVAMSGGVDSSVAAGLLAATRDEVFGVMMRLWSAADGLPNRCCSPADVERARQVAALLDIPFYVVDAQAPFKTHVVDFFVAGYAQGITPNPCLECNRLIRWQFLLRQALALGATHLATGHYATVTHESGRFLLRRAIDRGKDQSYVLSVMGQVELRHAVFPLGSMSKEAVRATAREWGLPVADRRDSQDLCFVANGDYRRFLESQGAPLPPPGPILTSAGETLGEHRGLAHYTIGQRKGLGLSASSPLYVIAKDLEANALVVGPGELRFRQRFLVSRVNWVAGEPPGERFDASVQVRYRSHDVPASIQCLPGGDAKVETHQPLQDVTPGQGAVFYRGDICLGGGVIKA